MSRYPEKAEERTHSRSDGDIRAGFARQPRGRAETNHCRARHRESDLHRRSREGLHCRCRLGHARSGHVQLAASKG